MGSFSHHCLNLNGEKLSLLYHKDNLLLLHHIVIFVTI